MSVAALSYVWENSKQEGGSLLVMLALADYANDKGESFPANKTLARKARLGERHTQRIIQQLVSAGEIISEPNAGPKGVNIYRIIRGGDKMTGETPTSPGGDVGVAKGETPTAPKPSGNRQEPSVLFPLPPKQKNQKIGTVNGHKPSQKEIEDFCVSVGLPRRDGELMLLKWMADGWPKNWMDKIRYWKRAGFMPSQKGKPPPDEPETEPEGWAEWMAAHPRYAELHNSATYKTTSSWIKKEFNDERKLNGQHHS